MLIRNANADVLICASEEAAAREAAGRFALESVRAVANRGVCWIAIPGGSGPKRMFELLAADDLLRVVPWDSVHVFFTDERCVPPDSPQSNYRLARELLLDRVRIPDSNVHRFRTDLEGPEAAANYEEEMRAVMGHRPRLDLAILGMGTDTHTASLFPRSPALHVADRLAAFNQVGGAVGDRLTLTLPALCAARSIVILAAGAEKADAVRDALVGEFDPEKHPVQAVRPVDGTMLWILTRLSAARL